MDWVEDVYGCTAYTEEDLHQVLIRKGFKDHDIRVEQIKLALSKNKLECNSGYYFHSSPCF
jgi:DNA-binding transcriptional MerR regulator